MLEYSALSNYKTMYTLSRFAKVFLRGLIYLKEISEIKVLSLLATMGFEPRRTLCIYEQILRPQNLHDKQYCSIRRYLHIIKVIGKHL